MPALLLLLTVTLAQAPGLPWRGTPVHPGCLRLLTTDLPDATPVVAAVDLEGCTRSNRFSDAPEVDGRVLRWRQPEGGDRGYFQYEFLGSLANGVLVARTAESGGGSGIFQELLFMRITPSTVLDNGEPRTREMLTLVGSESLGDRDRTTIALSGDTVTITRREFLGARGYGPEKTTVRRVQ
jgi:hypothetical protein